MFTGWSLSFCVRDIAAGYVPLEQVDKIIVATNAPTPEIIDEVIAGYRKYYWGDDPDNCEAIARQLFAEGKVDQPRTRGEKPHSAANGHWMEEFRLIPNIREYMEEYHPEAIGAQVNS